jgi:hypothetical protein
MDSLITGGHLIRSTRRPQRPLRRWGSIAMQLRQAMRDRYHVAL